MIRTLRRTLWWIARVFNTRKRIKRRLALPRRRFLRLEVLEERVAPAAFTVNSLADTSNSGGVLTLRDAILVENGTLAIGSLGAAEQAQITGPLNAPGGDTIVFAPALAGQTISLNAVDDTSFGNSAFLINSQLTIQGDPTLGITIARDTNAADYAGGQLLDFRLFDVATTGNLTLENLTLANGLAQGGNGASVGPNAPASSGGGAAGLGGAIFNQGTLSLINGICTGDTAVGGNGGTGGTFYYTNRYYSGGGGGGVGGDGAGSGGGGPNGGAGGVVITYGIPSVIPGGSPGGFGGGGGGGGGNPNGQGGSGADGGFGGGGGGGYGTGQYGHNGGGGDGGFGGGGGGGGGGGTFGGGGGLDGGGGAGFGGAIFNAAGTLAIENSTLTGDTAQGGSSPNGGAGYGFGGAIFNLNGMLTLTGDTLSGNTVAAADGAPTDGVDVYTLGLDGVLVSSTGSTTVGSAAGAVYSASSTVFGGGTGSSNNVVTVNSNISWTGAAGDNNFDDPANWNGDFIPTSVNNAVINTTAATTIAPFGAAVNSLTTSSNDTLTIFNLTVFADSTFNGPLTILGTDALTASGAGVTVVANGATTISTDFYTLTGVNAVNGATLSLPELTSADSAAFTASGGSTLDLPGMTSFTNGSLEVTGAGSLVSTPDLTTATNSSFVADAGGTLDLPLLTSIGSLTMTGGTANFGAAPVAVTGTLNGTGGTISASGGIIIASGANFAIAASANLVVDGSLTINGSGTFSLQPAAALAISGNLLGSASAGQFTLQGSVLLDGAGSISSPQELEVMSAELGDTPAGFTNNAVVGTLALSDNTYVQLVDQFNNSGSGAPEALYVNNLVVPAGCTLDLNGLNVYARVESIAGSVINGTINVLAPPGGPLDLNSAVSGTISTTYPVNSWTFSGQAGQPVLIVVQTGNAGSPPSPIAPALNFAQVQLLDSQNNVLATQTNSLAGADIDLLGDISANGTCTIEVEAPPGQPGSVGNYNISLANAYAPTFTAATPTPTTAGSPYSYQFQATGVGPAPLTFSAMGLPSWAQFDPASGILSGTPTADGTYQFSVTASDGVAPDATEDVFVIVGAAAVTTFNVSAGTTANIPSDDYLGGIIFNVGANATVNINGGAFVGGMVFNVAPGATVNLLGNETISGTLTGSGSGAVDFSSGTVSPGLGGLTLNFRGSMFQWTGGDFFTALGDVTNLGTINLVGSNDKHLNDDGVLDNFGAIIQTGAGNLALHSDNLTPTTLKNETGASYLIESDSGIVNDGGATAVINAGAIIKTAGSGTSTLDIDGPLTNTGTIEADSGTLYLDANSITQISGSTLTGGTWNAVAGATLQFPGGTAITSNQGTLTLNGAGSTIIGIAGLASNSGAFVVTNGAAFTTAGDFNNSGSLTVGPGSTFTVNGNFTQTSTGTLNDQIGGNPGSGLFGQTAVSGTATLAGSFDVALANGFSPSSGQDFAVITFASATGSFTSFGGLSPFFTESLVSTGLSLDDAATDAVDLALTSVTAPTTADVGESITVNWQAADLSSQATTGSWQDSIYISSTPTITSSSTLLGSVPETSAVGGGASYSASLTAPLPTLAPGYYYVLVQVDSLYQLPDPNRANNVLAATTGQVDIGLPALTLGTPYADSFSAANQNNYYQVSVPAGGTLSVSLQSTAPSGAVALYISQGTLPTQYNYQQAATLANQPNQTAVIPQVLAAGTYFILAHSVSGAAATATYTITVTQTAAVSISAISPDTGGNAGNVTVEIDGTNFTPSATANLTLGGTIISASSMDFVNASQMFATFNLTGAATGNYTLRVLQSAQSVPVPNTFQVVAANVPSLSVDLSVPQYVRSGRTGTIVVTYSNDSANDIVAPLLDISSTNTNVSFSTPDDPNDYGQTAQVLAVAPSGPAGILRPGQSGQLTLTLLSNDTIDGDEIPVQVSQIEAGQTIDWASQQATLQPLSIPTAAWNVIYGNFEAMAGTTTDSYNAALAQAATYLSGLGETTAQVSDVDTLFSFLIAPPQATFPGTTLISAVDAALPTPGNLSLGIDRTFVSTIAGRYTAGIFGLGWTTSWQTSLSVDGSGNVTIDAGGALAYFPMQANGAYLDTDGEYGTLTLSAGIYTFTNTTGAQFVFLPSGLLNFEQDTNGNCITLGYNGQNQLVTLAYSNPSDPSEPAEQLSLSYNVQGFVSQESDGAGDVWTYTYDGAGHLLSVTTPGPTVAGLTTSYSYDTGSNPETANALLSITNPDGSQENFTSSSTTGQLTGASANGGTLATTYTYLGEGEVEATDSAGDQTIVWFNERGLPARVQDPLGGISTYLYDTNGNLVSTTDPDGNTYQYTYDQNGNLTQSVNPLGQTVQMTYGALGKLTSITDAAGNTTQYNFNSAGNLLSIVYPGGTQQSFTYDPLGNPTATTLQNGDPINYQYNSAGLVTQENFSDGSTENYTYDSHGNILTATDSSGTTTLTYNAANELTSISYPGGLSLTYTYNAQGQRTQSMDQSGYTLTYSYDSLGRLIGLSDGSGMVVTYTYYNLGQLSEKQNGNGTYTTYAYDAAGNLTSEVNYSPGATVNSSFAYTYNLLNEITSMTDAAGNVTTYGYDALGQLTQMTLPGGGGVITYVYDAAGNRTEVINSGAVTNYTSNADNQITQAGSTTYTYDADGNLLTTTDASGTTTYAYNDQNELVSITASDGTVTTFQFSPLGFMAGMNINGTQTNYLVDPTGLGNVVASYNSSGSLIAHFNFGLGLASQTGTSGAGYYDFDATSNTVGITGSSGTYVNQYSYAPFGATSTISAALPNPFTFVGQAGVMQIGGNLFSMHAREFSPMLAQFLSNDPTGLAGGDANIRRYVGNSPVNAIDPDGLAQDGDQPIGTRLRAVQDVQTEIFSYEQDVNVNKSRTSDKAFNQNDGYTQTDGPAHGPINIPDNDGPVPDVPIIPLQGNKNIVIRASHDPNALVGPAGFGTQSFIQPTGALPYTIEFENDGSVATQDVTVTEQLDPNLDWSTFQLGSFGFGPINVTIPAGLTEYETTVAYENSDGSSLNVHVALSFNVQTGLLSATFTSLDPLTGQAPTGVFDGFLYPESDSVVASDGYVEYTLSAKPQAATGTAINQQASVVFDTNAALATQTVTNTIDAGPPTSSVNSLPTDSPASFNVSWSGQDDANGSGIAFYDVYDSDDGGAYTLWQSATTATSALFTGQTGHTYSFYSVATDNVGNVQLTPGAAQATTLVNSTALTADIGSPSATLTTGGPVTYSVTVADPDFNPTTLTVGDFSLDATGTATGTLALTGTGSSQTLSISGISGDGTLGVTLAANSIADLDGSTNPSAVVSATFIVDNTPPTATITAQPPSFTTSASAGFSFTGSDPTAGGVSSGVDYLQYSLDGGAFTTAGSPLTLNGLAAGTHTFEVEAVDNAGNVGAPVSYSWTIQTVSMTTLTDNGPNPASTAQSIGFTVTVSGGVPNGETVTLEDASNDNALVPSSGNTLVNGSATLTVAAGALAVGVHNLFAVYGGDADFVDSQSTTVSQTVDMPTAITSAHAATFISGHASSFTVTTTGSPTAAITENGLLPTNITFHDNGNGTATISGTPIPGSGTYVINITANNGQSPAVTQVFTLTVLFPPTVTSADSTTFAVGTKGTFTPTATAGFPTATTITETGVLPTGVKFTDGKLTGKPAAGTGGSYPITFTASNTSASSTQAFTLVVDQAPVITSANKATFIEDKAGSFTITTTGFPFPTITSSTLPGLILTDNHNGTATLSGTPTTTGTFPVTITASNGIGTNATQTLTLTLALPPTITSANSITFAVGTAGSFTPTATPGFPATTTFTESGALPTGVKFTNGKLSGTPAAGTGGSYSISFTAGNGFASSTQAFTLKIDQAPAITSANKATFVENQAGSFTITTSGYPFPTITSSALPGLILTDNIGSATLSGTPTTTGTFPVTITASNGIGANATQTLTLTLALAPTITSADSTTFAVGTKGSFAPTASAGFPTTTTITESGTLPKGVKFTSGALTGTPAVGTGGSYSITFTAGNGFASSTQEFTLSVDQAPAITSANKATFVEDRTNPNFTITTTGFPFPTITSGTLPTGLTLTDNHNGTATLSGTPTVTGTDSVTIMAANGIGTNATQTLTLTLTLAPTITSANNATFAVGTAGSFTPMATPGFPTTTTITETGTLPKGVKFTSGKLSGTPAANTGGSYAITFTAGNGFASSSQAFTLAVDQKPAITSAATTTFVEGESGTFTITTTGFPISTITCTTLPAGLTFTDNHNGTATLSGTPYAGTGGAYTLTITASDGNLPNAVQSFTLDVDAPPAFTSANSVTFIAGETNTFMVTTTGFPVATIQESGTLPTGVTLVDNHNGTATLSGKPTKDGIYFITLSATEGEFAASEVFTITVS